MIRVAGWTMVAVAALVAQDVAAADTRKPPYYASIAASRARMRTGPGRSYPASWLYQRADLPVRVVDIYKEWRKIEDPDGTQGWMLASLLSSRRTAFVRGAPVELRLHPAPDAPVSWRAATGVVGQLSQCGNGWCRFDVHGQAGFVEEARLWGLESGETLP